MNLKSFHLVFISCAIALAILFGAWALGDSGLRAARASHGGRRLRARRRPRRYEVWFLRFSRRTR
jgi:hypothetical protein